MKKYYLIVCSTAVLMLLPGCFRAEVQTTDYSIPQMNTPASAAYIQGKIKSVPGIVDSSYNLKTHILTVDYQSSTIRSMNIEEAISLAGYAVNNRPANPKAKLPQGL